MSIETLETRKVTSPSSQYLGDIEPAFSPDGQSLAFVRRGAELAISELYIVPVAGGEATRLTFDNQMIDGPAWTADGREIVFASNRESRTGLWRVSASGGTPARLESGGDDARAPTISRQGDHLAYVQQSFDLNIWRVEVPSSRGRNNSPLKLISSTRLDFGPQISPDGKRIVFQSDRSGSAEIWVCDSDGLNPLQLTSFGGNYTGTPRWSPDGRQIAFDSRLQDNADIYVINADGGLPRRLTTETSQDVVPSWSRAGQWIYFGSKRSGDWQVWKKPVAGGEAIQVTKQGGFAAFESLDGEFVYYAKFDADGLWRVPVEGGQETLVLDLLKGGGYWGHWALVDQGVYFVNPEAKPHPAIEFFNFATQRVTRIAVPEKELIPGPPNLAVSPDGRWILYTQLDQSGSDIMLVENFK